MTAPFGHGLVVGKFYPPHRGHLYLIERGGRPVPPGDGAGDGSAGRRHWRSPTGWRGCGRAARACRR